MKIHWLSFCFLLIITATESKQLRGMIVASEVYDQRVRDASTTHQTIHPTTEDNNSLLFKPPSENGLRSNPLNTNYQLPMVYQTGWNYPLENNNISG